MNREEEDILFPIPPLSPLQDEVDYYSAPFGISPIPNAFWIMVSAEEELESE